MKNAFKTFQSKIFSTVHGTTTIDHKMRIKMKMTCSEYVMADAIHKMMIKNKETTNGRIYRWTGFTFDSKPNQGAILLKKLKSKGWIDQNPETKNIFVTSRYQAVMKLELDDDFEFFWQKRGDRQWSGSKKEGRKLFNILSIKVGGKYLISQKEDYFKFLLFETNRSRPIMNVTTFLDPKKERFAEPWNEFLQDVMKRAGIETDMEKAAKREGKTMTYAEKEKRFE